MSRLREKLTRWNSGGTFQLLLLIAGMLVTGVANTLLTKYQDQQCVRNCNDPNPENRKYFEQPVLQTLQMFVGEMGCWLVYGLQGLYKHVFHKTPIAYEPLSTTDIDTVSPPSPALSRRSSTIEKKPLTGARVLHLSVPAICDICGTTLMNVGLTLVAASIYQMTRGALVLFVGILSIVYLRRRLYAFHWLALAFVFFGVFIVGLAGALFKGHDDSRADSPPPSLLTRDPDLPPTNLIVSAIIGIFCIAFAQIFTAFQFVREERLMELYLLAPLKVVGWEGVFGFSVTALVMAIGHLAYGRFPSGEHGYFDAVEGWDQFMHNPKIFVTSLWIMVSIGGFNFFGISITRKLSATPRAIIDTCRTLFIWMVSLALGWESFKWLQVVGFALLVYGTFLYNEIVPPPFDSWRVSRPGAEEDRPVENLREEDVVEHQ